MACQVVRACFIFHVSDSILACCVFTLKMGACCGLLHVVAYRCALLHFVASWPKFIPYSLVGRQPRWIVLLTWPWVCLNRLRFRLHTIKSCRTTYLRPNRWIYNDYMQKNARFCQACQLLKSRMGSRFRVIQVVKLYLARWLDMGVPFITLKFRHTLSMKVT